MKKNTVWHVRYDQSFRGLDKISYNDTFLGVEDMHDALKTFVANQLLMSMPGGKGGTRAPCERIVVRECNKVGELSA